MKLKKLESGRSMVEMLGVLAIIGVLSVGGIAGYTLAMRKHRANAVLDFVSKQSVMAYNLCQQKVLNGEIVTGSDGKLDLTGCSTGYLIPNGRYFEELGTPPAGVDDVYHGSVEINTTTGVDAVYTTVEFSDKKLCQAVASIAGGTCDGNWLYMIKINQN